MAETYERWRTIDSPLLSPNGEWVVYVLNSHIGEDQLVVRSTGSADEFRVALGRGLPDLLTNDPQLVSRGRLMITADSRYVLFPGAQHNTETVEGDLEVDSCRSGLLGIMKLPTGQVTTLSNVCSFSIPKLSGDYVAYTTRDDSRKGEQTTRSNELKSSKTGLMSTSERRRVHGNLLVLHELTSGTEIKIPEVTEYVFEDRGRYLAYAVASQRQSGDGAYLRRLRNGNVTSLAHGVGDYANLTFDNSGEQVAFLSNRDEPGLHSLRYTLYHAPSLSVAAEPVVRAAALGDERIITSNTDLQFTREGDALIFTVSKAPAESEAATASQAIFDLWHWKDPVIRPLQNAMQMHPSSGSYLAVYFIASGRWIQLESESSPAVLLSHDARYAVAVDQRPYKIEETWGEFTADVSVINLTSGRTKPLLHEYRTSERLPFGPFELSPGGRFLLYFDNRRWFSYELERETSVDLTGHLLPDEPFDIDYPPLRPSMPIGIGGWTKNDERVLIYARRDIWELDPTGVIAPRNLTGGVGRRENIVFRLWPHDINYGGLGVQQELDGTFVEDPLLLTAFDEDTMETGFWQVWRAKKEEAKPLLMRDKQLTLLAKTPSPTKYLVTEQTFEQYPDLWVGEQLNKLERISDANPQQAEYRWGTAELVNWVSSFGLPLRGILYKPEGFDPKIRYPLIVNIYGLMSYQFHSYFTPQPSAAANIASPATYLSKGYVVFMPDVHGLRNLGQGALASVVPGVESLIERGYIDSSRIGLVGHSLGGRQVAYIVAHSNLFRCAVEGAGVTNTISHYGSVSRGVSASYKYERGGFASQYGSAFVGSSVWEIPQLYLENSAVMSADRVTTPLLMIHNEDDNVVPFEQAVEFYIALRRNRKEAYLFSYKNERHNLSRYPNRLDWDRRMQEFLDHYLKNAPKPSWMVRKGRYPHKGNGTDATMSDAL